MNTKKRIAAIRLMQKLEQNAEYAENASLLKRKRTTYTLSIPRRVSFQSRK